MDRVSVSTMVKPHLRSVCPACGFCYVRHRGVRSVSLVSDSKGNKRRVVSWSRDGYYCCKCGVVLDG